MVPLFTKPSCLDGSCWRPFTDTVGKREVSWASHNLAAEGINTEVTAKYPVRDHLYSAGIPGAVAPWMWSWAELIRYCVQESTFVLYLKCQNVYPGPPFPKPGALSCHYSFRWVTARAWGVSGWGIGGRNPLVQQDAGDTPLTWNDRGLLHEQNSYQNYLLCQSTRPGLVLAEESQGTFNSPCLEECMCVRSWICHLSALVQY